MKKAPLFLLLALLLSGCGWMEGSYVSVTPHVVTPDQSPEDTIQVSSYSQLRSALTDLVDAGAVHGVFSLSDYAQDHIQSDMVLALNYVQNTYPIGAYAVESITYDLGSDGRQNVMTVDISYRHGKSEIDRIQTVWSISGAKTAIATALRQYEPSIVLQITNYESTDFTQMVADYGAAYPQTIIEIPQVSENIYPSSGDVRVVELVFTYQTSRDSLRSMQNKVLPVFSSAQLYVSSDADEQVQFTQLYTFLTERFDYTIETSITPSYSLLCHGVGDSKAFAQVYAAMCSQVGLKCQVVSGTRDGESHFWNIIRIGDTYYHLDLLRSLRDGSFAQRSDSEMQGYVWDYSAYPVCGVQTSTEATEPTP